MKKKEKKQKQIELIKSHWEDEDFHKIRQSFLDYLIGEGYISGDEYLDSLCHLLGSSTVCGEDGWDVWHELDSPDYIEFIKI